MSTSDANVVARRSTHAVVGQVEADEVVAPVATGRPGEPVRVLGGERAVRPDEERRQPQPGSPAGGADVVEQLRKGPEVVADPEALAQPGAPPVVDLHHVDDEVAVVEGAEVGADVVGGDLLEVAVPGAPHRGRGRERDVEGGSERVAVPRQRGLRVLAGGGLDRSGSSDEHPVVDQGRDEGGYVDRAGGCRSTGREHRCRGRPRARPRPAGRRGRAPYRVGSAWCAASPRRDAGRGAPTGYQVAGLQLCQPSA